MNALDPTVLNAEREWESALTNSCLSSENGIQELFRRGVKPFNAPSPWKKQEDPVGTLERAIAFCASAGVVRQLLEAGAVPTAFEGAHKFHALDNLLQNPKRYPDDLVELLLKAKATLTQPEHGTCTLHHAVQYRPIEVVRLLVNAKAHATIQTYVDAPKAKKTNDLCKLVLLAQEEGNVARKLADEAEIQKRKQEKRAREEEVRQSDLNQALDSAVKQLEPGTRIRKLLEAKAEVRGDHLNTLINRVSFVEVAYNVDLLLKAKAEPLNGDDSTLNCAIVHTPVAVIDLLLKAKALPNADAFDKALRRSADVIRGLLDAGVQPPVDALSKAVRAGCEEGVARVLVEKGYKLDSRDSFEKIQENREQADQILYSQETMDLIETTLPPREEARVEPPAGEPVNQQPVEEGAPPSYDEAVGRPWPGEERIFPQQRSGILGCIAQIFAGLWACIEGIIDYFCSDL